MTSSMDRLMDRVKWEPIDQSTINRMDGLYATHKGILEIMDYKFRCFLLNNMKRVIHSEDINNFFGLSND